MNHNKSNKVLITILIVMAVIAAVLLATIVGYIVGFNNGKKIKGCNDDVSKSTVIETKNQETDMEETTLAQTTKEEEVDVSSIKVGKYTSDNQSEDSVYADGGDLLEITSIRGRTVAFKYTSISSAPSNRVASIKVSSATFDEKGRAKFKFDEDGWENRGTGMLYINSNKTIQMDISITGRNTEAMWEVGGSYPLSYLGK